MKLWTESESLTSDMAAVSFESLRSMCSDREQVRLTDDFVSHQLSVIVNR